MIYWLVALGANIFGWYSDFDESRRKAYYGKQEGNLFFRNEKGQLNVKKAVVMFLLVEILPSVVLMLFLHHAKGESQSDNIGYYAGACWNIVFGVLHYITARGNIKKSKERRALQKAKLAEWQAKEWTREEFARAYLRSFRSSDGETFLLLFAWIRVPNQSNSEETLYTLADALLAWSKTGVFPDTKYDK